VSLVILTGLEEEFLVASGGQTLHYPDCIFEAAKSHEMVEH
jgi:hypothetical protein